MDRDKLDGWCEWGILGLVLSMLVYGPLATGAVREFDFSVLLLLITGVALLWLTRLWLNPRERLLWPPLAWVVLAFTLYAGARYLTADIEYVARPELLRVVMYALLFWAVVANLHRQSSITFITFTLIFLGMAIAGYAIFQFATGSNRVWNFISPYPQRGSGTYICPNHTAGFLELALPLAAAYTLAGRIKPLTRVALGYGALMMGVGLVATVSRGGLVAAGISLLLMMFVLLGQRAHRLPAAVALLLVLVAGLAIATQSMTVRIRFNRIASGEGQLHENTRYALWRPAALMWREHPLWGVGPGHFNYRFREYRPAGVQLTPDRVHNDYLNTLTDWGLAGAALVAAALALAGWGVAQTWRHVQSGNGDLGGKRGSNKFAVVLGSATGLAAILIHSLVDFNMQVPANAMVAVTLLALLSGHLRFATDDHWHRVPRWACGAATLALLPVLGWLAWQGVAGLRESAWLERAERAPNFSAQRAGFLQRALEINPRNAQTAYDIGECYRVQSLEGGDDYEALGRQAIAWYERSRADNPWDAYACLRLGQCLDWLGQSEAAAPWFDRAEKLDPNGYFTLANVGLHYVALGDYAAARPWFERSLKLKSEDNLIARSYLDIARRRLLDAAERGASAGRTGSNR